MRQNARAHSFSSGIAGNALIEVALGRPILRQRGKNLAGKLLDQVRYGAELKPREKDIVVGWGRKANTRRAMRFADQHDMPYVALEDGFIGYLGHPSFDGRRLSLIMDHSGIYYDATRPSDLESLLNGRTPLRDDERAAVREIIKRIKVSQISKYNHAPTQLPEALVTGDADRKRVLVVDQTRGDMSIELGLASEGSFQAMLDAALEEHSDADIIIKVHPDVLAGTKRGHYNPNLAANDPRVTFLADEVAPQTLLGAVDHVYVVTSQYGFEALLAGKPVTVFGAPFYAGWGLTDDRGEIPDRRGKALDLETLVHAALVEYPIYLDPYDGERTDIETVLDYLEAEKAMPRLTARRVFALGFGIWKRSFIERFCPGASLFQPITARALTMLDLRSGDAVLVWGRKWDDHVSDLPEGVDVWRMEDGFLRSVGLGSDLKRPNSLVLDRQGIYYDGSQPSALEAFLKSHEFTPPQLARGARLRSEILSARVSKYNVGASKALDFRTKAGGRKVILVPGQVESDASLAFGSPVVNSNEKLLLAAREREKGAYIVYKPHPDVISGNRDGAADPGGLYDEIVVDADIIDCLDAVDGVHTMTSLTGFEALIRGLPVTCYGRPFYAGWGLTDDYLEMPRRGRNLPLDAVVFALLCVYARYVSWPDGMSSVPEQVVEAMKQSPRGGSVASDSLVTKVRNLLRKAGFLLSALLR